MNKSTPQPKEPMPFGECGGFGLAQFCFRSSRLVAVVLIGTAVLKILSVIRTPVAPIRADAVVSFFTSREVLMLASFFELVVGSLLIKSRNIRMSAALVLYFSACASVYQLGLFFQGDVSCSCLGIAADWLGGGTTTALSRAMLVAMWMVGVALLIYAHKTPPVVCLPFAVLLCLIGPPTACPAATLAIEGEYAWVSWSERTGKTNAARRAFNVLLNDKALRITSLNPDAGPRGGACTEVSFVDMEVVVNVLQCEDSVAQSGYLGVAIDSAEAAWGLGNCRDSLTSWVFLTLRCSELFPVARPTRRLASPSTTLGEPLGVVTEAHYAFSAQTDGAEMVCDLVVQGALKKVWRASPLVTPERLEREELERETQNLARYPNGFLLETMRFSRFTNVAGFHFPMLAESTLFAPQHTKGLRSRPTGRPVAAVKVALAKIVYSHDDAVTLLPLSGPMTISEGRLRDRRLHLRGCGYQTNQLATFEITPGARAAFETELQRARAKRKAEQTKRLFTAMLAALVFGVPGAIYLFQRWKGKPEKTKISEPTTKHIL